MKSKSYFKYLLFTQIALLSFNLIAQSSENNNTDNKLNKQDILLTINDEPVTVADFENIYKKNSNVNAEGEKNLEEYLQLFINYKLKVKEAENLGLDTLAKFNKEFTNYKKQLASPYLSDNEVTAHLIKEAYERLKWEVRASHILIKVDPDAGSEDTLKAYKQALSIKKRLEKGEDFAKLAMQLSEDPSAKTNKGDLGYFSAFRMVYPFETAAFETPVGKISNPVKTRFGYHILKVTDKRSARGEIKVAHIMKRASDKTPIEERAIARKEIEDLNKKLKSGANFAELAQKLSDDKSSAGKGGELPVFGTGRMVQEFEDAAFALKADGDISEPFKSEYGWHIIKRISLKEIGSYEELKEDIKKRIAKDSRSVKTADLFIKKIKDEYKFEEYITAKQEFFSKVDDQILKGKWEKKNAHDLNKPLFKIGTKTYTQSDFADNLEKVQTKKLGGTKETFLAVAYQQFVDISCYDYEESKLEEKYPEYRNLMKEYRDGILLFELTDQKVWTMAVKDTLGLKNYHAAHRTAYMWPQRADAMVFTCMNEDIAKKTRALAKKKKNTRKSILDKINADNSSNLTIVEDKFTKGDNAFVDEVSWEKGIYDYKDSNGKIVFVKINKIIEPEPKTLNEARGLVIADFQNYLEKEWIKQLREKYKVQVNQQVFEQLLNHR